MHRAFVLIVPIMVAVLGHDFPCSGQTTSQPAESQLDRSRALLKLFLDGQFGDFVQHGDEAMKANFTVERARATFSDVDKQLGPYLSEISARLENRGEFVVSVFKLRYQLGTVQIDVVTDKLGRLSGFWVRVPELDSASSKPAYAKEAEYHEEPVKLVTGEYKLSGTLTLPNGKGRFPAVVLVHGSGPLDQDETVAANKPFRDLAWGLAGRGVAVLRYEKRTRKYVKLRPETTTLEAETMDDALTAVKLLRARSDIDPQRIFVLGHSLGATAAPFIAARDKDISGIIMMGAAARSILDLLDEQIDYISKQEPQLTDEQSRQIELIHRATAAIREGKISEVKGPLFNAPAVYWERLHKLDVVGETRSLKLPILIIQGGRDYQVSTKCYRIWQKELKDHRNVTFKLYDKLNHLMIAGDGPSTPAEYSVAGHVDLHLIEDIASWIKAGGH